MSNYRDTHLLRPTVFLRLRYTAVYRADTGDRHVSIDDEYLGIVTIAHHYSWRMQAQLRQTGSAPLLLQREPVGNLATWRNVIRLFGGVVCVRGHRRKN